MFELLRSHIEQRIPLTEEEFNLSTRFFVPRTIRKRQFLLQEGDVCRNVAFVNNGCLREYTIDAKGNEHIIQFAIRDWWISDLNSFLSGEPTVHSIDALQTSEVLLLERSKREEMFKLIPKMERFFRLLLESHHVASQKRINEALGASAEERYLIFLQTYPKLVEQIPQNHIASYLGITPQSLSRIRKELSRKA